MNEVIIKYIIEELQGGDNDLKILPDDDLLGSGLVESMGMMRLIQFLEEKYEFKVAPMDMTIDNFITVDAISNYIKKVKS